MRFQFKAKTTNIKKSLGEALGLLPESSEGIVPSESQAGRHYLSHDWEELTLAFLDYLIHHIVDVPRGSQLLTPHDLGYDLKQLHEDRCFTSDRTV